LKVCRDRIEGTMGELANSRAAFYLIVMEIKKMPISSNDNLVIIDEAGPFISMRNHAERSGGARRGIVRIDRLLSLSDAEKKKERAPGWLK
jgi:hypothetical protein